MQAFPPPNVQDCVEKSPIDQWLGYFWPSTKGALRDEQYFQLISELYQDSATLIIGYATILCPVLMIAWCEGKGYLFGVVALAIPIMVLRVVQCQRYKTRALEDRKATVYRDEVRYVAATIAVATVIDIVTASTVLNGSLESRLIMTVVVVFYTAGIMARNANSPKLVTVLCATVLAPVVIGLLLTTQPVATLLAVMICLFTKHIQQRSYCGQRLIVDALLQADEAERLSNFDVLTGLPNRHNLAKTLLKTVGHSEKRKTLSVLMIDLDGFKAVNDTRGHPAGDELLVGVATRIQEIVNRHAPGSFAARPGGDEFVVLTDSHDEIIAKDIIAILNEPVELKSGVVCVGASIGIMRWSPGITDVALMKGADLALYAAKASGRGSYEFFNEAMFAHADMTDLREQRFRTALAEKLITMVYQPIVNLRTGEVVSVEALARWDDPVLGQVSPTDFIPIAERTGLIERLSGQLLLRACVDACSWSVPLPFSYNVSALEFFYPQKLIANISAALKQSQLDPRRLTIEITEGVLIRDFETVMNTLDALRAFGIKISLDDFGVGYSSLSYLSKLGSRLDAIKLDRSFVQTASTDSVQTAIITMVAEIARKLDADVIVEGVENLSTAISMRILGATHAQGYYFGRPAPGVFVNSSSLSIIHDLSHSHGEAGVGSNRLCLVK